MGRIKFNGVLFLMVLQIFLVATTTGDERFELYIHLVDLDGRTFNARYDDFKISDEDNGYALSLGKFNGTIEDAMRYSENMKFTTFDHDNDEDDDNCADWFESGWWYKACSDCYLNVPNRNLGWWDADNYISLKEVKMIIRPKEEMKK
ncbi:fibrinogen-like protein 1 isoform X6 [Drosophila albomicans]|uniref:Fibrinogen-like protein 1 isoform X6 n=1 Tax=Drosophila albomicans TaxID=7291 RepID=A0A9C6WCW8_DROAB|nr:fibrinogen-like protein 1 isoform X6 [Drosophila albomicans]